MPQWYKPVTDEYKHLVLNILHYYQSDLNHVYPYRPLSTINVQGTKHGTIDNVIMCSGHWAIVVSLLIYKSHINLHTRTLLSRFECYPLNIHPTKCAHGCCFDGFLSTDGLVQAINIPINVPKALRLTFPVSLKQPWLESTKNDNQITIKLCTTGRPHIIAVAPHDYRVSNHRQHDWLFNGSSKLTTRNTAKVRLWEIRSSIAGRFFTAWRHVQRIYCTQWPRAINVTLP